MGYRCERCNHEWVPRDIAQEPNVCPKCKSPHWNSPRKNPAPVLSYEDFRDKIKQTLMESGAITWTELRTIAKLPEKFPNNKWVHQLEEDIALRRNRDSAGIIKWTLQ